MSGDKFKKTQKVDLKRSIIESRSDLSDEKLKKSSFSSVSSQDISKSLTQAQNQLGLCLQKQRQVGFILREVKDILKR